MRLNCLAASMLPLLAGNAAFSQAAEPIAPAAIVYDDLDRFSAAMRSVDSGVAPVESFEAYVASGTPVFPFYRDRYGATGESIAAAVAKRPKHYRRVAALKPEVRKFEPAIASGLAKLAQLMPGIDPPPIYFLVGNLTAGGIHAALTPQVGEHGTAPAVLLETVAMAPETDMSEFPGSYGGAYLKDIPYVAIHEMVHAYQARLMGMANYVSIFKPGPSSTYLSQAVREGCADYVTLLATGSRRTGNQHSYGVAHEAELWAQFKAVKDKPLSFDDGWFGRLDPETPDWPPQIGYWVGSRMCQAYHEAATDKAAAMREIFGAYLPEHMQKIAAPYARRFD